MVDSDSEPQLIDSAQGANNADHLPNPWRPKVPQGIFRVLPLPLKR